MLRRWFVCLAFATWCFANTWVELAEGDGAYYARYNPLRAVVVPVLCWVALLALGMCAIWELCRRRGYTRAILVHVLFLASSLVPLGIASVALVRSAPFDLVPIVHKSLFWPLVLAAAVVPAGAAVLRPRKASRVLRTLCLSSWPVLALILFAAARAGLSYPDAAYADGPLAPALRSPLHSTQPRIRVVWVIFDELSQAIAFDNRPPSLACPNLDRLKGESFYATSAHAPGNSTEVSMPALTLGEKVVEAIPQGTRDLLLRTRRRPEPFAWDSVPNVFDTARELGFDTALAGWFHPYGRELNRSLTKCYWTAGWLLSGIEEPFQHQSLASVMRDRARLQIATLPLVGHLPGMFPGVYHRADKAARFSYLLNRSRQLAADPWIGLVLLHLPVPHPPAIYDRSKGVITAEGSIGYPDSVALADRALGTLRQAIEQAGLWDRTALLVSSDHGWRTSMWRGTAEWTAEEEALSRYKTSDVPFLVRLPGQTAGFFPYSRRFNTLVTRQIITGILTGQLTAPTQLPDLIERRGATRLGPETSLATTLASPQFHALVATAVHCKHTSAHELPPSPTARPRSKEPGKAGDYKQEMAHPLQSPRSSGRVCVFGPFEARLRIGEVRP